MDEERLLKDLQLQLIHSQEPPRLGNQFLEDSALRDYIGLYFAKMKLSTEAISEIITTLSRLGAKADEYNKYALDAERNIPQLQLFDAYGKKVNVIHTSEGWKKLREISIQERMISDNYEKKFGVASRFVQVLKMYLFHASSGMWSGPMATTDGAAALLKSLIGSKHPYEPEIKKYFERLVSTDPSQAWSSGQWTIEKEGHIDPIQRIQTVANPTNDPYIYKLYGLKWYTMTPEGEVSIAAARIIDSKTGIPDQRLSAFLVKLKNDAGELKPAIDITRLKSKFGTRTVPAAELILKGVDAVLISGRGEGVKFLSAMINITRLYNSSAAVSFARRVHVLCKDYSLR